MRIELPGQRTMISFFKKLWRDRRGNALIIAAGALPLVIGSAGLASDTIQWTLWKRQLQRAADSAALAGVYARVQDNSGQTPSQAVSNDLSKNNQTGIALLSGYPQVSYPSDTSTYSKAVRVQLALKKKLGFSSVFMASEPTIIAEATAATIKTGVYCVVSLEDMSVTGITATGNSTINLGCGMITNSTSLSAAIATGSSSVYATPIAAVGDIQASSNWNSAELLPFTLKEQDPFADITPNTSSCTSPSNLRVNANETATVNPGCYADITLNGIVTMNPGIYILDGGSLSIGSQARVTCNGCTFVLTNSSGGSNPTIGTADINGGAQVNLRPPNSGTYKNLIMYQDRRASSASNQVNRINGNSASLFEGAMYFPRQELDINGTANLNFNCAQFVSRKVTFSGNGSINNNCSGGYGGNSIMGEHVRLVG